MNYSKLKEGQKIFFTGEEIPMDLIARTERFGVVVRSLDIKEDFNLLMFEVERGAAHDSKQAYEENKGEPIYSLLDFEKEKRAPSNMIFNPYDYWSKEDCCKCVKALDDGEHELSRRHGIDLNIDWFRTLEI